MLTGVSVASIVIGGVLLLIGGGIGYYGYGKFRVARAIKSTPDHIEDFVVQQPNLRPQFDQSVGVDMGNKDGDRRYYEGTVQDGDSVYVLGDVHPTAEGGTVTGPSDGVIQPPEGDGLFVVSTLSESELFRWTRWQKLALGVGAIVGLFGLGAVLSGVAGLF
ncbi:hypothetical protein DV733_09915 [Halapricum salinum]|uniref:RING-type E3 ubiquitin transferase n=1 Tax=Halapricum salinum TaxID=1457250 RepID=A0A4D6HC30_9EURY|nr:hypothetical protein DV733_09915 [Halapricum salinum]